MLSTGESIGTPCMLTEKQKNPSPLHPPPTKPNHPARQTEGTAGSGLGGARRGAPAAPHVDATTWSQQGTKQKIDR